MATLPGLRPVQNRRVSGGGRALDPVRAQLPTLTPRQITTPQAAPVDTFTPEPQPQGAGDGWMSLARGLADFSPKLQQFVDQETDKEKTLQEARAEAKIGGQTLDQQKEFIKTGQIANWEGPWARARYMQLAGSNAGQSAALEMVKQYEQGFDPATGDLEGLITGSYQAGIEAVGDNPFAQRQFARAFDDVAGRLRAQNTQAKSAVFKQNSADSTTQNFMGTIAQYEADGKTPAETFTALRATQKVNADTGLMTMAEGDKVLMDVAERAARAGNHALAKEILWNTRDGVGALGNKAENLNRAVQIDELGRSTQFEMNQRAQPAAMEGILQKVSDGAASREEIEQGVQQGLYGTEQATRLQLQNSEARTRNLTAAQKVQEKTAVRAAADASRQAALGDAWAQSVAGQGVYLRDRTILGDDGEEKTLTVKDQQDASIAKWRETSAMVPDLTPAGRALHDSINFFGPNGFDDKVLQGDLAAAADSVRGVDVQKGLPPLERALDGYDKWRAVYGQMPMYAQQSLLKSDTQRRFYEDVRIGIEYQGLTREQSMANAIRLSARDYRRSANLTGEEKAAIRNAADEITLAPQRETPLGKMWWWGDAGTAPTNSTQVRDEIEMLAQRNMDNGVSPDRAVEIATEQYTNSHVNINGRAVLANAKAYMPDIGAKITGQLRRIYDAGPIPGVDDFEDLSVTPDGTIAGRWQVIDASGLPVSVPGLGPIYVTMDDLRAVEAAKADAAQGSAINTTVQNQNEAQAEMKSRTERALPNVDDMLQRMETE
jgi:hypothetical protein